jgi:hypothetical protein
MSERKSINLFIGKGVPAQPSAPDEQLPRNKPVILFAYGGIVTLRCRPRGNRFGRRSTRFFVDELSYELSQGLDAEVGEGWCLPIDVIDPDESVFWFKVV